MTPYYKALLESWFDWIRSEMDAGNIKEQQLFFNENIKRPNGQTIFYPSLIQKGIINIKDIIDDRNLFKNGETVMEEYDLTFVEFMQYVSIKHCISDDIKLLLNNALIVDTTQTRKTKMQILEKMSPKQIYDSVLVQHVTRPTSEIKLGELLAIDFEESDWENVYRLPFLATIESKLRAFQFKINHNIYYTNQKLHTVKISDTPLCYFCKTEIEHLFVSCTHTLPLWRFLSDLLSVTHSTSSFSTAQKLLGLHHMIEKSNYDIVNHMMITLKYYVHVCKHKKILPSTEGLIESIKDTAVIEQRIASRKNKLDRHHDKWDAILTELNILDA